MAKPADTGRVQGDVADDYRPRLAGPLQRVLTRLEIVAETRLQVATAIADLASPITRTRIALAAGNVAALAELLAELHLGDGGPYNELRSHLRITRGELCAYAHEEHDFTIKRLAKACGVSRQRIEELMAAARKDLTA